MSNEIRIEQPVWNRFYTPIRLDEETVHVQSSPISGATLTINEPGVSHSIIECIDGRTTTTEIIESYPDEDRAVSIIRELEENKIILEASRDGIDFPASPISPLRLRNQEFDEPHSRVLVLQNGKVNEDFYRYIYEVGIKNISVSALNEDGSLPKFVTTVDHEDVDFGSYDCAAYLGNSGFDKFSRQFNRKLFQGRIPGIFGVQDGFDGFVGPTVFPEETGCLRCFLERLAVNSRQSARLRAYLNAEKTTNDSIHANLRFDIMAGFLAIELVNLAIHDLNITTGRFLHINSMNMDFSTEALLRDPNCEVCSPDGGQTPRVEVTEQIVGGDWIQ